MKAFFQRLMNFITVLVVIITVLIQYNSEINLQTFLGTYLIEGVILCGINYVLFSKFQIWNDVKISIDN